MSRSHFLPEAKIKRVKDAVRRAGKARHFPMNTCAASRHLHIMADGLLRKGGYPMLQEEPVHCAESILAVIACLWEARTMLAELREQPEPSGKGE